MSRSISLLAASAAILFSTPPAGAVTIPTVPVGNAGNVGHVQSQGTFGAVAYDYRIGTHEVTNAQYVAFLNAIDTHGNNGLGLYNSEMTLNSRGGINFDSNALIGSKYSPKNGRETRPVNYVNWFDAARVARRTHPRAHDASRLDAMVLVDGSFGGQS